MITNTLVRKAVQVEYSILRAPLAMIDRQLATHLGDDSKVRFPFELGLDSLDAVAGRLLARPGSAQRSEAKTRQSDEQPDATTPQPVEPTLEDEVERVAEELLEEQEQKPVAGELADPDLDVAEVQAELRAKHLLQEHDEEQRLKQEHEERVKAAAAASGKPPAKKLAATRALAKNATPDDAAAPAKD